MPCPVESGCNRLNSCAAGAQLAHASTAQGDGVATERRRPADLDAETCLGRGRSTSSAPSHRQPGRRAESTFQGNAWGNAMHGPCCLAALRAPGPKMSKSDVVQAQQHRQEGNRKEGSGSASPLSLHGKPDPDSAERSCDHKPTPALEKGPEVHGRGLRTAASSFGGRRRGGAARLTSLPDDDHPDNEIREAEDKPDPVGAHRNVGKHRPDTESQESRRNRERPDRSTATGHDLTLFEADAEALEKRRGPESEPDHA
jgi:hypothetical protein